TGGKVVRGIMSFYNRRFTTMAKRRWATGYVKRNAGWRELYDGFVPETLLLKHISRGLRRWFKCELINLGLLLRRPIVSAEQGSAVVHTDVSAVTSTRKFIAGAPADANRITG